MKKIIYLLFFIILCVPAVGQHINYFVSATGNDANDGLTINTPWQTIQKVNSFPFQPGDAILFEGGKTFHGTIYFTSSHSGTSNSPVILKSYGQGKAIIHGGATNAIEIWNAEYVEIRDLEVMGNGRYNNHGTGIYITTDRTDKMLPGVVIDNIDAHGFYWGGIGIGAEAEATMGFLNLRITHCDVFENGMAGIQTWGAWNEALGKSLFSHKGLYIGYTRAFNNHGLSNYTSNWSGTGILMAGVENGLIEYCEAFENGAENGCSGGGPVGIWLANAKGCIVQHCESYNNKAGKTYDGGGYDIDGGSQNCILQYNYSHDNEGAGFALFEWGNNLPFINNIIRYNISQNDGRKNGYGGLTFWAIDTNHKLIDCEVYNNTIYVSNEKTVAGTPTALKFMGINMKGLKIRNNVFYTTTGVNMLHSTYTFDTTKIHLQNNNYFDTTGSPRFIYRTTYTSLKAFKAAALGQEMRGSLSLGLSVDPLFVNPGGGKNIKPSEGGELTYMTAYMQQPGSPLIDNGLDLETLYGLNIGDRDFYNNKLSNEIKFDLGANEFNALKFQTLEQNTFNITANKENDIIHVSGRIIAPSAVYQIQYQISSDGKTYSTIHTDNVKDNNLDIGVSSKIISKSKGSFYVRARASQRNGTVFYSNIAKIFAGNSVKAPTLYPNPVNSVANFMYSGKQKVRSISISNLQGQQMYHQVLDALGKNVVIDLEHLRPGIYYYEFLLDENVKTSPVLFVKL